MIRRLRRPVALVRTPTLRLYLWSGSWSGWCRMPCPDCRNLYVGPFGVEWGRH